MNTNLPLIKITTPCHKRDDSMNFSLKEWMDIFREYLIVVSMATVFAVIVLWGIAIMGGGLYLIYRLFSSLIEGNFC